MLFFSRALTNLQYVVELRACALAHSVPVSTRTYIHIAVETIALPMNHCMVLDSWLYNAPILSQLTNAAGWQYKCSG
jgi:Mg2+/citrate symporter